MQPSIYLQLSNCVISNQLQALASQTSTLILRNMELHDGVLEKVSQSLMGVVELDLSGNRQIHPVYLTWMIRKMKKIKFLSLYRCQLKTDQARIVQQNLVKIVHRENLQHLDIADTDVEISTIQTVLEAVRESKSLQAIHLSRKEEIR